MDMWHVINVGGDVWYESEREVIAVVSCSCQLVS
jgi:hypothetical protein